MQPLEITIIDQDGGGQKRWTFAGDYAVIVARIEAMIRTSSNPADRSANYALAIRSEVFNTLYVCGRNPNGPRIDDIKRALRWSEPAWAWAWWQRNKGDDTRHVEVVHATTGEAIEPGDFLDAEGGED